MISKSTIGVQPACFRYYGTSSLACIAVVPLLLKFSATKNSGVTRSGLRLDTDYLVGNIQEHYIHSSNSIGFHKYDGYDTIVYNNKNLSENNN